MQSTRGGTRSSSSRLSDSLLRLQQTVQSARSRGTESQAQFDEWFARWENSREQIVHRLSLIDAHLQELVEERDRGPRLAVHAN